MLDFKHGASALFRTALSVVAAAVAAAACAGASQATGHDAVIEGVTVISPERSAAMGPVNVAIRDGRISAIGAGAGGLAARRFDGRGRYLIPGLIDSHVHIGQLTVLDEDTIDRRPELVREYRAQLPRAFLAFGFTTLVDLDLRPRREAWFEQAPVHPRLFHCGRAAPIAGGYGALRVPADASEENFPHLLYEPAQAARWPTTLDPSKHTPALIVERVVVAQGICVKTFVEPGFGIFDWPVPRPETLRALHDEAVRNGLKFVVHATSVEAWRAALEAGADVIAHGLWHWPGERMNPTPPQDVRRVIDAAARVGVRVQPTLRILRSERSIFDRSLLQDPRMSWALPTAILNYLRTDEARQAELALQRSYEEGARKAGVAAGAAAGIDVANARADATLRLMYEANVALILGSDTPSGEGIGNPPGLNGRLEMQHWADAGVPLARILRAATLDNADALGLSRDLGSVEVGKFADLVLLGANPLKSVDAYDSIEIVFLNGEPIARSTLGAPSSNEDR